MTLTTDPEELKRILTSQRETLLKEALAIVTKDRNQAYGEPEDTFELIARYWSVYLQAKYGFFIEDQDVPILMSLMKIARLTRNSRHWDSMVDVAGYMACLAEIE